MSERETVEPDIFSKCIEIADEAMKSTGRGFPTWRDDSLAQMLFDHYSDKHCDEIELRDFAEKYLLRAGTVVLTKKELMSVNKDNPGTRVFYYVGVYSGIFTFMSFIWTLFLIFYLKKDSNDWECIFLISVGIISFIIGYINDENLKEYFKKLRGHGSS